MEEELLAKFGHQTLAQVAAELQFVGRKLLGPMWDELGEWLREEVRVLYKPDG